MGVGICGYCNVWVCEFVRFLMFVCECVDFVMCECVYVWVCNEWVCVCLVF